MLSALVLAQAEEEPSPVLPHTSEIILGFIAFVLLLWVLNKYVVPRFEKLYQERHEAIEGGIERADRARAEAEEMRQKYQSQLADVRAEAAKVRDDARLEAEQIREDARVEAQAEAARIVAAGQAQLQAHRQQVVAELRGDYGRNSIELASRIVGESLEDETRRRGTVERFLAELDAEGARN